MDRAAKPPALVISPVDFDSEWDDLFSSWWNAWKHPLQAPGQLTFANIGQGGGKEAESFAASKKACLAAARADGSQTWMKIEDKSRASKGLSSIVGGGVYTLQATGTLERGTEWEETGVVALFEPGSEEQALSSQFHKQLQEWRPRVMGRRAHIYGNAIWVIPEYRELAAGAAMMDYWVERVDETGLDAFIEGTSMGTPLYLKYGFVLIARPVMHFHRINPSQKWVRLVRELQSDPVSILWRPGTGTRKEGTAGMSLPWPAKQNKL